MSSRQDTLDIIPNDFMRFVKNGRVIQGTWKKIENHKIYGPGTVSDESKMIKTL